ncbi:MAG: hypothetical protein JXB17_04050 [Bacteroidales bacterium]|nr:hypothetical protein [Bacteroidales bacterium]
MNEKLKKHVFIAVPTNDGITVFPKMLGRARYFLIYTSTDNRKFTLVEKRDNPFEKTMQHLKTLDVYNLINDCDIIIAALISKKGIEKLKSKGVVLLFKKGNIENALKNIVKDELSDK